MFKRYPQENLTSLRCTHCGDECPPDPIMTEEKAFCCQGCQVVYHILMENGMGDYYQFEQNPGVSQRSVHSRNYVFLDDPDVVKNLLEFSEEHISKISFALPQIHCASCIWLLENLSKLNPGVLNSRVNFLRKTATVTFDPRLVSLRQLVELLATIGYPPELNLQKLTEAKGMAQDRSLYYKLGLAGFSFGNIMLLSFPEYLGFAQASVKFYIGYINILLALPVLLYSGMDYLRSGWWAVKMRQINIDIPIAIGMLTLFFRSVYEIISETGEGYLDSLAGFIFFLLIGKWFQHYTFQSITFDRNYKSYFPISAMVKSGEEFVSRSLDKLTSGDILWVKNEEIIPGDALLLKGEASIDYSFVTGESDLLKKKEGDKLFAGGKNIGRNIHIQLLKDVSQSYLTKLWDEDSFRIDKDSQTQTLISRISRYFTWTVLVIAALTLSYWLFTDTSVAFNAFTAVLIVACPCALALAMPFSYGNIMRILGRRHFYLKNVQVIDRIQGITEVVFDKTGTLTAHKSIHLEYSGHELTPVQKSGIKTAAAQSNHPISKAIVKYFADEEYSTTTDKFEEITGQGTTTVWKGQTLRIGSPIFILGKESREKNVLIEYNGEVIGQFKVSHTLRKGVDQLVKDLSSKFNISILSGDNDREKEKLLKIFPQHTDMIFNQSPKDKLEYIRQKQAQGLKVMMIGDGLNDSGALMQSDVGIVISEDSNNFTPACDAILGARVFDKFVHYLKYLRVARFIIIGAFVISFFYNIVGLYFAVRGELSPVIAAIIMPVSSVTVMVYGLLASTLVFRKVFK